MRLACDIGNIEETGWSISLDIGRFSALLGELLHGYGLRLAWYTISLCRYIEIGTKGIQYKESEP